MKVEFPGLDVETRWFSTFNMIRKGFKARKVIVASINRIPEISDELSEDEWRRCDKVANFLEAAASMTENQSGSSYVTLSITSKAYLKLIKHCEKQIQQKHDCLKDIAKKMVDKLNSYKSLICTDVASLSRIFDVRIANDIISDSDILRRHIVLPDNTTNSADDQPKSFIDSVIDEDSCDYGGFDDEISTFLKCTMTAQKDMDPLLW